jgi:hypothetical protein
MSERATVVRQAKPVSAPTTRGATLQRTCACGKHSGNGGECAECRKKRLGLQRRAVGRGPDVAPPIVHEVLRSPGRPLDDQTRGFMESRFGHDFSRVRATAPRLATAGLTVGPANDSFEREAERQSQKVMHTQATTVLSGSPVGPNFSRVRVHTGPAAAESARAVNALAYTIGDHVIFGAGQYAPGTSAGRRLLAHELTHVAQQSEFVRPYRPSSAFNFGKDDDLTLKEDSFNPKTDKETKPWIQLVTVTFTTTKTDVNGDHYWEGTAIAQYYANAAKLPDFTFTVAGGSAELGRTDAGNFTVQRIEGIGYNSGTFSGREGVDYLASEREGPRKRYSKNLIANMSFAVFYNKGEALHAGPIDVSSHGCVHVEWADIKQLNYHSVIGLTKVKVTYPSAGKGKP